MTMLRVIVGPDAGARIDLGEFAVTIGRSTECGLPITDEYASMIHAVVEPCDAGWRVRDLESMSGTTVNGLTTSEKRLILGDVITIGQTAIVFASDTQKVGQESLGNAESSF